MEFFYTIALVIFILSFYIQFRIYDKTDKKRVLLIIPGVFIIPTVYTIIKLWSESALSPTLIYFVIAIFVGVPIVVGSLLSGIIIVIRNRDSEN